MPPVKPQSPSSKTVKSRIRNSFTIPRSMGKALSDVINKDSSVSPPTSLPKASKVGLGPTGSATSRIVAPKFPSNTSRNNTENASSFRGKTSTSPSPSPSPSLARTKTLSSLHLNHQSSFSTSSISTFSLRPRTSNQGSNLPKYRARPVSMIAGPASKLTSPPRATSTRMLYGNGNPKKAGGRSSTGDTSSSDYKRPGLISPPTKRTFKRPDSREEASDSSERVSSPSTRLQKRTLMMSHGSSLPNTPTKSLLPSRRQTPSPSKFAAAKPPPKPRLPLSPSDTPKNLTMSQRTPSSHHGDDESLDEDDVSFLLSGVAHPAQPTPSIPRTRSLAPNRENRLGDSQSSAGLRRQRSFSLSTLGASQLEDIGESSFSLDRTVNSSRTLSNIDQEDMISIVAAPFGHTPDTVERHLDAMLEPSTPNSPLSRLSGMVDELQPISQVLFSALSSPAASESRRLQHQHADPSLVEKLQLQIEHLELKLARVEEEHLTETLELSTRVMDLEERLRTQASEHAREIEDHVTYATSLAQQIEQASPAVTKPEPHPEEELKSRALEITSTAAAEWNHVREACASELESLHFERSVLATLLAGIETIHKPCFLST
ncbi:hypothetical protein SISNIDRAFT_483559 [Sistotremastrum niveocremeum HHB9708]|uniref:Uncharacterized protein n=1 Tax=Sistotremastrum niveocremeum HHB9708 TaxID=1314777 RepID=A0A164XPE9_9AGAM|nr:hypothetical protein SISNIDRAFT_483559 [Sistotremastrum niveocremeum HHB9708]